MDIVWENFFIAQTHADVAGCSFDYACTCWFCGRTGFLRLYFCNMLICWYTCWPLQFFSLLHAVCTVTWGTKACVVVIAFVCWDWIPVKLTDLAEIWTQDFLNMKKEACPVHCDVQEYGVMWGMDRYEFLPVMWWTHWYKFLYNKTN